jgi:hypothetical protein
MRARRRNLLAQDAPIVIGASSGALLARVFEFFPDFRAKSNSLIARLLARFWRCARRRLP